MQRREYRETRLGEAITLFKMHGSLNWSLENERFEIRDHVGAIFRKDSRRGDLAVVPPLREKDHPSWLSEVWRFAQPALARCGTWLVSGYSLPAYDEALNRFFQRAAADTSDLRIAILDPQARDLVGRWRQIAPHARVVVAAAGLPDVLDDRNWEGLLRALADHVE